MTLSLSPVLASWPLSHPPLLSLQMCLNHSTQFTHLGNIAETIK